MAGLISAAVGFFLVAGMTLLVGSAASSGGIDRSNVIGIRTRKTQASDEAWRAGHQAAEPVLITASCSAAAAGVLVIVLAATLDSLVPAGVIAAAAAIEYVVFLGIAVSRANKAAGAATSA